jgi:Ca2+/H+ antiporter, TMEM165/GDT1 family
MSGLLFALLATLLAGIGARDQLTVAALAARQGQRPGLILIAMATSIATAAAAACGGALLAPLMAGDARLMFAGLALAFAGGEMLFFSARRMPDEPTQSLGATAIVLSAHQLTDASRFLIFAIAVATHAPIPTGLGGALGGAGVVLAGWLAAGNLPKRQLSIIRRSVGAGLLILAAVLAMKAMGRI